MFKALKWPFMCLCAIKNIIIQFSHTITAIEQKVAVLSKFRVKNLQTSAIRWPWFRAAAKSFFLMISNELKEITNKTRCRTIAGSTARCGCKFWYVSKFSVASRGFHCDSNAFELNNSINHSKITVFNVIYLLPLNSLFNSHCAATVQNAEIVHSMMLRKPKRHGQCGIIELCIASRSKNSIL